MKRMRSMGLGLVLAAALLTAGCGPIGSATRTPGAATAGPTTPLLDDGRGAPALEVYPVALERARQWDPNAQLIQVTITRLMEQNLGLPSDLPGWFFEFRVPGSPVEFYIKTVDGAINGVTEAQPIIVGEPPYTYLPIDVDSLTLDSDDALRLFLENGGEAYLTSNPNMLVDYRLIHLEGKPNPVWSVFDATDLTAAPLYNVDAVTGQTTTDPYAP